MSECVRFFVRVLLPAMCQSWCQSVTANRVSDRMSVWSVGASPMSDSVSVCHRSGSMSNVCTCRRTKCI